MKINSRLYTAAVILLSSGFALAQDAPEGDSVRPTPEERQAEREARRAEWESMTDAERTAAREARRAQAKERFEGMSEEERQAWREQIHQRRGGPGGRHRGGGEEAL